MSTEKPAAPTVFSKDTFLTSLKENGGAQDSYAKLDSKIVVVEPEGMADVRAKYAQLHDVVGSLSSKIGTVLVKQEKDFLAAYRAHMYNVQKELHEMKQKMANADNSEKKNQKMKALEDERDWYRKEALRLDAFTSSMKKDLKIMKEKLVCIEEDRNWLEKHLKTSKKQNKLLRAELEIRLSSLHCQSVNGDSNTTNESNELNIDKDRSNEEELYTLLEEREAYYQKQIRTLKKDLQITRRELNKYRLSSHSTQSNNLEDFFVQCIDSVKKSINRRKNKLADSPSRNLEKKTNASPRSVNDNIVPDSAELNEFTSGDRVRVIEKLLSRDEVLSFLYENLFPQDVGGIKKKTIENEDILIRRSSTTLGTMEKNNSPIQVAPVPVRSATSMGIHEIIDENRQKFTSNAKAAPVGSGAAVASANRGIALEASTKEYLKSQRPESSLM